MIVSSYRTKEPVKSEPLCKVREAAASLSLSPSMIRKMIRAGDLPALRYGRAVRIPVAAVQALQQGETDFTPSTQALLKGVVEAAVSEEMQRLWAPMHTELARLRAEVDALRGTPPPRATQSASSDHARP